MINFEMLIAYLGDKEILTLFIISILTILSTLYVLWKWLCLILGLITKKLVYTKSRDDHFKLGFIYVMILGTLTYWTIMHPILDVYANITWNNGYISHMYNDLINLGLGITYFFVVAFNIMLGYHIRIKALDKEN